MSYCISEDANRATEWRDQEIVNLRHRLEVATVGMEAFRHQVGYLRDYMRSISLKTCDEWAKAQADRALEETK